ncbi:MAG: hypothetical protein ACI853_000315, partial [Paracoccaceae bacterium]
AAFFLTIFIACRSVSSVMARAPFLLLLGLSYS